MFSTKLSRLAQRATPRAPPPPAFVLANPSKTSTVCQRPAHQRRPSSSKASCPPDSNSSSGKPAPAANATAEGDEPATQPAAASRKAKKAGKSFGRQHQQPHSVAAERISGKGRNATAVEDRYAALPRVPDVQHMSKNDIDLASFFSLHRPLSLTSTIPPPTTPEAFSALFTLNPTTTDPWAHGNSAERRPEDVIYTLHTAIEGLENSTPDPENEEFRWEIIQESPSQHHGASAETIRHLDGAPRLKSLEDLVAQFRPFRPPPPPQPFVSEHLRRQEKKSSSSSSSSSSVTTVKQARVKKPQQKRYQTTIEVLEVTDPRDGTKSYSASSSPIIQLPDVEAEGQEEQHRQSELERQRESYLVRARRRQYLRLQHQQHVQPRRLPGAETGRSAVRRREGVPMPSMRLISVKRQRKLKMKKHKYKKLMKRTRNLRRRLDRT